MCASLLETCWCKLVSVYDNGLVPAIEAMGKANPGKRMELERLLREHYPKSPSGKYTSRQFLTENMSFDMSFWGVLTINLRRPEEMPFKSRRVDLYAKERVRA